LSDINGSVLKFVGLEIREFLVSGFILVVDESTALFEGLDCFLVEVVRDLTDGFGKISGRGVGRGILVSRVSTELGLSGNVSREVFGLVGVQIVRIL